jgi:hypothetical protein
MDLPACIPKALHMAICILSVHQLYLMLTLEFIFCIKENIFVTDSGEACMTDAGINASIMQIAHADRVRTPLGWPYKSPEELNMVNYISTLQMDVYSFACVVFAVGGLYPQIPLCFFLTLSSPDVYGSVSCRI